MISFLRITPNSLSKQFKYTRKRLLSKSLCTIFAKRVYHIRIALLILLKHDRGARYAPSPHDKYMGAEVHIHQSHNECIVIFERVRVPLTWKKLL